MSAIFPMPRYRIGDKVFRSGIVSTSGRHPCPDCLGSGEWKVITPAGAEMACVCQRCSSRYSTDKVPSLSYQTWAPSVTKLTIGSVRIDTAAPSEEAISYMCVETGVGSGSIYYEPTLFPTEAEASKDAEAQAATKRAEIEGAPRYLESLRFSHVDLIEARLKAADQSAWNAWWSYRRLKEDFEVILDAGKDRLSPDDVAALRDALDWENTSRESPTPEILASLRRIEELTHAPDNLTAHPQTTLDTIRALAVAAIAKANGDS